MAQPQRLIPAIPVTYSANVGGTDNLWFQKEALHSTRDPVREARRSAATLIDSPGNPAPLIVVGIGWGYVLEELRALAPERFAAMIFFEPSPEVFALLQEHGRLSALEDLGARLITDNAVALREAVARGPGSYRIEVLPAYARRFPDLGRQLQEFLQPAGGSGGTDVDTATRSHFLRQWTRNAFCRLADATGKLEFPGGASHEPVAGRSALYCGAGPGLPRDLDRLSSEFLQSATVIAVDTALAPLFARGIRPDLIISVDSGRGSYYHFAAAAALLPPEQLGHIPVLTNLAGPRFLQLWFDRILLYRSTTPLDQLLAAPGGALEGLPEWNNPPRNAVGPALHFARMIGAETLWTAGTSFRSDGSRSHVRGTGYTEFARECVRRTRSLEMYRPGGYGRELTAKNRVAVAGMEELARELGLAVRAIGDATSQELAAPQGPRAADPGAGFITVTTASLRRHLQHSFHHWNFAAWQRLGIRPEDLERWMLMLR